MFGLVRPYMNDLTEEEKARYKAVYCGLCRALNEMYGLAGRMGLNYDMTFLIILLDSLYEPQEQTKDAFCPPHPVKKHRETKSEFTDYAADMTVALTYYKALDDWMDEGSKTGKVYSGLLKRSYQQVKERWPRQCEAIEKSLDALHEVEKDEAAQPERAADLSGRMLAPSLAFRQFSSGKRRYAAYGNTFATASEYYDDVWNIIQCIYYRACPSADTNQRASLNRNNFTYVGNYRDLVEAERRRELMFEGKRYFDLVRRARRDGNPSHLASACTPKYTENAAAITIKLKEMDYIYMPYLKDEVEKNPNLKQNPSYAENETSAKN